MKAQLTNHTSLPPLKIVLENKRNVTVIDFFNMSLIVTPLKSVSETAIIKGFLNQIYYFTFEIKLTFTILT